MKSDDGTVFGPVEFEQIRDWAQEAQISPLDKVSSDEKNWVKAPMIPELEMDYLVETTPGHFYGPTSLNAMRQFLDNDEITTENVLINCRDNSESVVGDFLEIIPEHEESNQSPAEPVRISIRHSLQQRVRDLEEALLDERRARETAEAEVEKLETQLAELTQSGDYKISDNN